MSQAHEVVKRVARKHGVPIGLMNGGKTVIDNAQREAISELRRQGMGLSEIAYVLGMSRQLVQYHERKGFDANAA